MGRQGVSLHSRSVPLRVIVARYIDEAVLGSEQLSANNNGDSSSHDHHPGIGKGSEAKGVSLRCSCHPSRFNDIHSQMVGHTEEAVPGSEQVPSDHSTPSSSHIAVKEGDFEIKIEKPWIKSLNDTVYRDSTTFRLNPPNDFPTIFRVPGCIRSYNPTSYNPMIVSLGPYHHQYGSDAADCSPSLIDKLKLYYLRRFLKRRTGYSFDDYIKMIKDMEMKVRNAYSEPVMMSSDYFVRMMLLDCCFVLEIIKSIVFLHQPGEYNKVVHDDITAELRVNPIISIAASRHPLMIDMLLLENQLPMFLLEHLFACTRDVRHWPPNFSSLMLRFFSLMTPTTWSLDTGFSGEAHHFLHLFHSSVTSSVPRELKKNGPEPSCNYDVQHGHQLRCVPSAMQLQDAGVSFEKDEDAQKNFLCVTFERGRMKIPPLDVDEYTNPLFKNLIAFEQCYTKSIKQPMQQPHVGGGVQYFTRYATLMDCIINVDADVSLLQGKQIIINWLGNGEEVARLFNNLVKGTPVCVEQGYLSAVFSSLKNHSNAKCNRWKAKLNHDYLSSPWAGISLFGAVTLFLLTALQTTYTVMSYY